MLKKFAKKLNSLNLQRGSVASSSIIDEAIANGIVIVYGYSDDGMVFRGAIDAEFECHNGATCHIDKDGPIGNECSQDDCPYHQEVIDLSSRITSIWSDTGAPAWRYETDIEHQTFDISDDGELWCRGIIFRVDDIDTLKIDQETVAKCNELARRFYSMQGCDVDQGFRFDRATHPQEVLMWRMAAGAFDFVRFH